MILNKFSVFNIKKTPVPHNTIKTKSYHLLNVKYGESSKLYIALTTSANIKKYRKNNSQNIFGNYIRKISKTIYQFLSPISPPYSHN